MKRFHFSLTVLLFTIFVAFAHQAQAGGGNVLTAALNTGVAKEKGVEVIITVFEPNKNKLDWPELTKYSYNTSGYDPIGVQDLVLVVEYENPLTGQHCNTLDGGKTKEYGQVKAVCYSDTEGQFVVKATFTSDKPLYDGGPSSKGIVRTMAISFNQSTKLIVTPKPAVTPKPLVTPKPPPVKSTPSVVSSDTSGEEKTSETKEMLADIEKQNEEQAEQIEELEAKVENQEKEVSAIKKIILKIQGFLRKIFG